MRQAFHSIVLARTGPVRLEVADLGGIEPYVILPDAVPKNGVRMSDFQQHVRIDQAYIGSCANGQIEDFRRSVALPAT